MPTTVEETTSGNSVAAHFVGKTTTRSLWEKPDIDRYVERMVVKLKKDELMTLEGFFISRRGEFHVDELE